MDTGDDDRPEDYEVGYRKPPRHSRFPPGQSGNPRGRPKGARGLKTDLHTELSARHTIQINGRPIRGSRQQLMVMTLATRAASGDLKAQALLIPLILQVFGIEDRGSERQKLSPQDEALLDRILADFEGPEAALPAPDEATDTEDEEQDNG